jgi:hypothetical protein
MDGSRFDTLARAIAQSGSRRRLVSLLLALPLGGVLAIADEQGQVVAERPLDRLQWRTKQRNRKQRNNNQNNNQNKNNKNKNRNNNIQAHKQCNTVGGKQLSNFTCLTPCVFPDPPLPDRSGAVCPLPEAVCSAPDCHGDCCTVGIDGKLYCSLGEPSSVSCSRLDGCPKGQFCSASNDCRVACEGPESLAALSSPLPVMGP